MSNRNFTAIVATCLSLTGASACQDAHAPIKNASAPVVSLARHFYERGHLNFEQSDTALLVRASGVAIASDGRIAVGDASEGNVKIYTPDGRLRQILGRKGDGPNEFRAPRWLRFGSNGNLYVVDAQLGRAAVYDANLHYVRQVVLTKLGTLHAFGLTKTDAWVILSSVTSTRSVVHMLDSLGAPVRSFLPIRDVRPIEAASSSWLNSVADFRFAIRGDTAFVVSTVMDSLWWVDLHSGALGALHVPLPEYRQVREPQPSDQMPQTPAGLFQHLKQFDAAAAIVALPKHLIISFVRGVLNFGDPQTLAILHDDATWTIVRDAGPLVSVVNESLVTLTVTDHDPVGLRFFGVTRP